MATSAYRKPRSIAWNNSWNMRKDEYARKKPDGGFVFIPAMALLRAWRAYRKRIISQSDLRVWFACFEAVARRCGTSKNRFPRYTKEEIHHLVGGRNSMRIGAALRRLSRADLVEWSEESIRFPDLTVDSVDGFDLVFQQMVQLVDNHRRRVPVPRRTLRFLAGMTQPVLMATVLGHLLRCMYYRGGLCSPYGRCKSSWIADVFGVDARNVKSARKRLREMAWLTSGNSSQFALNRWGPVAYVNLAWQDVRPASSNSPPRRCSDVRQSPPPCNNRKLSSRRKHQKPAFASPSGVRSDIGPKLSDVNVEDLRHSDRLDLLWQQGQSAGLIGRGEADRLRFHAAAARALRVGIRNPPGLFATIVRRALWCHVTSRDEDAARRRLVNTKVPDFLTSSPLPSQAGGVSTLVRVIVEHLTSGVGPRVISRLTLAP